MKFQLLNDKIHELTTERDSRKALDAAIEAANEFIRILKPSASALADGEDALDEAIPVNQFPNQKVESWFAQHPYFTGERVALRFYSTDLVETKFYWLSDSATKSRVSAGVMLTPNWEDSSLTRNDSYRVGIDFFLTANTRSLLVAISDHGNLRILELNDKLSHTQIEILDKLRNVLELDTKDKVHEILWNALALREVNKKFYAGVAEQFNILLNHLITNGKDKEDSKLFASRLLGRLLFLWFLRKKNILDEDYKYFELQDADSTSYYDQTLSKLFFQTLNMPVHERQTQDTKTPYLNGGLFEAHDNDWAYSRVDFPPGFFNGLYEHLEKYNFTTDESSPEYEQVAIDPEMLGRVFESLLATQITETGEQANKAKGTFYTPREIVAYMCRESLRQYLYSRFDSDDQKVGIDRLLDTSDADWEKAHTNAVSDLLPGDRGRDFARSILATLDELKVLDPACGSGAFPMGMLQLVLKTCERLESRLDPYETKLQIIQNNIFGVDIEPMAVEISRLRAWLSLIVDEEHTSNVEPLPNLDFKFVCANSLIPLEELHQTGMFSDPTLHEKLAEVRTKFFNARKPEMKDRWKKEYYRLTSPKQQSMYADKREKQLRSFDPFKNEHSADFFDANYMFGVENFDLVIGNPPYVQVKKDTIPESRYPYSAGKDKGKQNLYKVFVEHGYNVVKEKGVVCYITQSSLMCDMSSSGTRELLLNGTSVDRIIEFPKVSSDKNAQVFDSVLQGTCIVLFAKSVSMSDHGFLLSADNNTTTIGGLKAASVTSAQIKLVHCKELYIPLVCSNDEMRIFIDTSRNMVKLTSFVEESQQGDFNLGNDKHHFGTTESDILMYRGIGFRKYTPIENVNKDGEREYIQGSFKHQRVEQNAHNVFLVSHNVSGTTDESRLIFTLTPKREFLCGDSINKILLKEPSFNLVLLGILNSRLLDWIFRRTSTNNHVNSYEIDMLPVPRPEILQSDVAEKIASLVKQVLSTKALDRTSATSEVEDEIDQLVYGLYGLTRESIGVIERQDR